MNTFQRIVRDERGAPALEYLIIAGMIALICYGGFQLFGSTLRAQLGGQSNSIGQVNTNLGP